MRYLLFFLVIAYIPAFAQSAPANAPSTTQVAGSEAVLAELKAANGLGVDTPNPRHLKAHFELQSADRKKVHTGTFEEWWSGHEQSKKSWTVDGRVSSLYSDSSGSYLEGDEPPIVLRYFLPRVFVKPVRSFKEGERLSAGESTFGDTNMRCLRLGDSSRPITLVTAVCFDEQSPLVRWASDSSLQQTFNQIVQFDGRYLARQIDIVGNRGKVLSVQIDVIEPLASWKADLFSPPSVAPRMGFVSSEYVISPPKLLKHLNPEYPQIAKAERLQGTVVLGAIVGADGSIRKLEPIVSAAPVLTDSAIRAIRDWKYQPARDHQSPVETSVVLACNFALGP
ncbi:MAG: energy transducer TonB [Acidobacteriaceae bacterium]